MMDWVALRLTLTLAIATTSILAIVGMPLAYWLATSRWRWKGMIESIVTLPLVLPPTVLGFYLLVLLSPSGWIGGTYERWFGGLIPFSFLGILIGSLLYNLPFAIRPFVAAFAGLNPRLVEASWCLGESRLGTWRRIVLPMCWPGLVSGMLLTFAHTIGEFGVVLMIGGNVPGVTRTLSIAIYDDVQALDYVSAGRMALSIVVVSWILICVAQWLAPSRGAP